MKDEQEKERERIRRGRGREALCEVMMKLGHIVDTWKISFYFFRVDTRSDQ